MSLITLNINLTRAVEALERIAVVLERAFPLPEFKETKLRGPETLVKSSPEKSWEQQEKRRLAKIREGEGLPPVDEPT